MLGSSQFQILLGQHGFPLLARAGAPSIVQINVGKVCNQACHHCHVEAGPKRTESMTRATAERVLQLLGATPMVTTVDITGGAPELNPNFRRLVAESRRLGRHVIDRCNLTVLLEPAMADLGEFLAVNRVEITASLPCYTRDNVERQRGLGVFDKSIQALLLLNRLGYAHHSDLPLNLVFNPGGPSLPPPQAALEADYHRRLRDDFGIEFNRLYTLTNMPIRRFAGMLHRLGKTDPYGMLLIDNFNPGTVEHLMCRSLVSVSWDGRLYDCDFNQMTGMPIAGSPTVWDIESFAPFDNSPIATADHCFGCTAGSGSSCGGNLV